MTPQEKQEHAAEIMQEHGFKPAGAEWLAALLEAQKEAKQIQRSKGIPDKHGGIKFYIAPSEDFTDESRRTLLPNGMGWFRDGTRVEEINPHTQTLKLTGCYVTFHAPSNQARVSFFEWTARSDGDAMASAHTRMTRRFIQGLLQIAVVDELAPEDPPGCEHPADQHVMQADTSIVCTLCSEFLGYLPPGQAPPGQAPPPPQQQQAAPPAQPMPPIQPFAQDSGGTVHAHYQQPGPGPQQHVRTPQQHANHQEIGQHQGSATGEPLPQPPAQPVPPHPQVPISQEPIVQQAQQTLEAEPVSQKQMNQELAPQAEVTALPGEPGSPDAWRDVFKAAGMDGETAAHVAMISDGATVEPVLVEDMRNWAWVHYEGNTDAMQQAWIDVGFTPVTGIPVEERPRPTGIQAKRFLANMKFTAPAPAK